MDDTIKTYIEKMMFEGTPKRPAWAYNKINSDNIYTLKWSYDDAVMINAFIRLYEVTGNKKYLSFSNEFFKAYVSEDGKMLGYELEKYNIDNLCAGYTLMDLYRYTKENRYKIAYETLFKQFKNHPRTEKGSFWHKLIYPNQVWLDGLYMGQPFYAKYLKENNDKLNDVYLQFENMKYQYNKEKKLYYHGYDDTKTIFWSDPKTGCSKNFWSRSMGWFLMAMVDVLEIEKNKKLAIQLKQAIDGILLYAKEGLIYQVIDREDVKGNYLETSGSAMLIYAMIKGHRLGALSEKYLIKGKEYLKNLVSRKLINNNLQDCNLVSGLGPESNLLRNGTVEYYLSEKKVNNDPKAIGPFLMAYAEYIESEKIK
ncbi:Glycosyl hydrolase, family 88 [Alteracholeplasma palmae J233]|uniref:Glycosyl hydrolase, family 88 n=1 Tax=Alteracholeplasma palmae (strain ATCC 49389 / J233) TaxID=1318466 RepID=U4KKP1_ALTPJ|nr:glycoside hydrolase family 88 protein [Alteracholeplasma palmae]CCV64222.1 Glycosyl hydrolase, family 88 [Alteracholeplasma palmae J233]